MALAAKRLLVTALERSDLDAGRIAALLRAAEERAKQLQYGPEADPHWASLIERVELKPKALRLSSKLPVPTSATPGVAVPITHELPLQVRRRGVRNACSSRAKERSVRGSIGRCSKPRRAGIAGWTNWSRAAPFR